MTKEDLITNIKVLADFVRTDANTFLWAKSQPNFAQEKAQVSGSNYDIGGGNFFIALGSLAYISLLAKIYRICKNPNQSHFKRNGQFQNETDAVEEFFKEINGHVKWIDNVSNIIEFWQLMRHGLAHCYVPKGGNSSVSAIDHLAFKTDMNFYSCVQNLSNSQDYAIKKKDRGGFVCWADLLAVRAHESATWLISKLEEQSLSKDTLNKMSRLFDA